MDGFKKRHIPVLIFALAISAPVKFAKAIWGAVTGKGCKVPGCGMDAVKGGLCQGHWDGRIP